MLRFLQCTCYHQVISVNKCIKLMRPICSTSFVRQLSKPIESKEGFCNENPDSFGTIKKDINAVLSTLPEEKGDVISFDIIDETGRKKSRTIDYYIKLIKEYINEHKLVEAIDVLETKMKNDRVKPNYYVYNLLINGCASVGFSEKAFKLYNQMKKHGIKVTPATYTGLFNAYANARYEKNTVDRVNHLRELILEKNYEPNLINYHAMIKAYGRCGDLLSAFCIVDEMMKKEFSLTSTTISFLMQACISDKEAGFRHALFVWKKMNQKFIIPDLYAYNLLLRCTRDCGLGDETVARNTIEQIIGSSLPQKSENFARAQNTELQTTVNDITLGEIASSTNEKLIPDDGKINNSDCKELVDLSRVNNAPNLIAHKPHLGNIVDLSQVKRPEHRLVLLGGYKNILNSMKLDGVKPDKKTFALLFEIIPSTLTAEKTLLEEMKDSGIEIDVTICNILIKRRAFRDDFENARDVLRLMQSVYITPDIMTFGALAIGCRNLRQAESLINDIQEFGYRVNTEILGAMLKQACHRVNFSYVVFLMKYALRKDVRPNKQFLEHLEIFNENLRTWKRARKSKREDAELKEAPKFLNETWFVQGLRMFTPYYNEWIQQIEEEKVVHPRHLFAKKIPTSSNQDHQRNEEEKGERKSGTDRNEERTGEMNDNDSRRNQRRNDRRGDEMNDNVSRRSQWRSNQTDGEMNDNITRGSQWRSIRTDSEINDNTLQRNQWRNNWTKSKMNDNVSQRSHWRNDWMDGEMNDNASRRSQWRDNRAVGETNEDVSRRNQWKNDRTNGEMNDNVSQSRADRKMSDNISGSGADGEMNDNILRRSQRRRNGR